MPQALFCQLFVRLLEGRLVGEQGFDGDEPLKAMAAITRVL